MYVDHSTNAISANEINDVLNEVGLGSVVKYDCFKDAGAPRIDLSTNNQAVKRAHNGIGGGMTKEYHRATYILQQTAKNLIRLFQMISSSSAASKTTETMITEMENLFDETFDKSKFRMDLKGKRCNYDFYLYQHRCMLLHGCSIKNIVVEALDNTVICVTHKFKLLESKNNDDDEDDDDDDDDYETFHFLATIDNDSSESNRKIIGIKPMTSQAMVSVFQTFMKNNGSNKEQSIT